MLRLSTPPCHTTANVDPVEDAGKFQMKVMCRLVLANFRIAPRYRFDCGFKRMTECAVAYGDSGRPRSSARAAPPGIHSGFMNA